MKKRSLDWLRTLALIALVVALLPAGGLAAQGGEIDQAALWHDSRSDLYRVPGGAVPVETPVTLRFRAAAGDLDAVTVRAWDALAEREIMLPMAVVTTTPDGYDLWETTLDTGKTPTIYWYRFIVTAGGETLYYEDDTRPGEDGLYYAPNEGGPGAVYAASPDLSYQITVYDPAFYTPRWMRNAVIYQIFPDRFRNGDPSNDPADGSDVFYGDLPLLFHETWNEPPVDGRVTQAPSGAGYYNSDFFGGDLAGIIEKLDYLEDLGVTAIYLNPIFEARSNHRYDAADFKAVDPLLGDLETFRELVAEADARGIVLILDGAFNHLSSDSVFFDRYGRFETEGACESLESEWRNWFFFVPPKGEQPSPCVDTPTGATYYTSWAGYDSIPKIDSTRPEPRLYFFVGRNSVANTWGREGIGGWRLDVGGDIDSGGPANDYWEGFRVAARNNNPEAVIIGEEWGDAARWLLGKEWDSTMNYRLRAGILGFARAEDFTDNDANGDRIIYALAPSEVEGVIRAIEEDYPAAAYYAMMNLLDSHDTSRLPFVLGNDPQRQKLAALLQFTLPGAPTIYYGDEIALDAPSQPDSGGNLQDDPYNRAPYPWPDASGDHYPPPDEDMLAFYQQIAALRHDHPALREGDMITLLADDTAGVYAFLRVNRAAGSAAIVALNQNDQDQTVTVEFGGLLPGNLTLEPAFGGEPVDTASGSATLDVPALGGNVWTAKRHASFVAPRPPANLSAEGQTGSVALAWEAVPGAAGYAIFRSPVAAGGFERISPELVTETSYVDEAVTDGFVYHYAVASISADGLIGTPGESAMAIPSAAIGETFYLTDRFEPVQLAYGAAVNVEAALQIEGTTEAEGPADGVRAEAALIPAGGDLDEARWLPMQYAGEGDGWDRYAASVPLTAAGEFEAVARFSTNAGESWTVVTLKGGVFPALTVEPHDDTTAPDAPASVTVNRAVSSGVSLEWAASASDDVAAYRVYRTERGGEPALLAEIPAGETTYTDRGVTVDARYTYAVATVDGGLNESEATASEEVTVQRPIVAVTFVVTVPDYTSQGEGDVYIAGSFGAPDLPNWDPAGLVMEQVDDTHWTITLDLPEGAKLEYKYVRGTWDAVEKGPECEEIANRRVTVALPEGADGLLVDTDLVAKWRDLDKCG